MKVTLIKQGFVFLLLWVLKKAELAVMHSMPNPNLNANHLKSVLSLNNNQRRFSRLTHEKHTLTTSPYFQHRFTYQYTRTC